MIIATIIALIALFSGRMRQYIAQFRSSGSSQKRPRNCKNSKGETVMEPRVDYLKAGRSVYDAMFGWRNTSVNAGSRNRWWKRPFGLLNCLGNRRNHLVWVLHMESGWRFIALVVTLAWDHPLVRLRPTEILHAHLSVAFHAVRVAVRVCYSFHRLSTTCMPPTPSKSL